MPCFISSPRMSLMYVPHTSHTRPSCSTFISHILSLSTTWFPFFLSTALAGHLERSEEGCAAGSNVGVTGSQIRSSDRIASRNVSGELGGSDHSSSGDPRTSPSIPTASLVMHVQKQLQRSSMPRRSAGRASSVVQMLLAGSAGPAGVPMQRPTSEQLVGVDAYDEDGPLRLSPASAYAVHARRSLTSPSASSSSRLVPPHAAIGPSSSGSTSNGPGSRDNTLIVRHPLSGSSTR